jgi:hypothetical protein
MNRPMGLMPSSASRRRIIDASPKLYTTEISKVLARSSRRAATLFGLTWCARRRRLTQARRTDNLFSGFNLR